MRGGEISSTSPDTLRSTVGFTAVPFDEGHAVPSEVTDPLRTVLGADPPNSVQDLPPRARAELADLIAAARRRQARELASSYHAALVHVPGPLRRLVRKVLTG